MTMNSLPQQKTGDWWDGITLVRVTLQGQPLNLAGAAIVFRVRPFDSDAVSLEKSVAAGGITITNAAAGEFAVDGFTVALPANKYFVEIRITAADGKPRTVLEAEWKITSKMGV